MFTFASQNERKQLEDMIVSSGGEWREPNFMAERMQDILDDDVTHLFEGSCSSFHLSPQIQPTHDLSFR